MNRSNRGHKTETKLYAIKYHKNLNYAKRIEDSCILEHTLDNAIKDVTKAYDSAFANLSARNIKGFRLRYKKATKNKQVITIEGGTSMCYNSFCTSILGNFIKSSEPIKGYTKDCRMSYDYNSRRFTIFIPYNKPTVNTANRIDECSLDPGVRTFQSCYSSDGCVSIGDGYQRITKLFNKMDNVKKENCRKKVERKVRKKIGNLVTDLHWKTANYLCKRFDNIYIGKLSTISVIKRDGNLNKMSKRVLQALSHFTFRQRLKSKCEDLNVKFHEVNESWTSKVCGNCNEVNYFLGAAKTFNCPFCNVIIDRDFNGARNILIKTKQTKAWGCGAP
jgi:putative transposase